MKLLFIILFCTALTSCAVWKGGMPSSSFNTETDLGLAKNEIANFASVKTYYDSPSLQTRNKYLSVKLLLINYEYLNYIKGLTSEEAIVHSASELLVLALDITATALSVPNSKTIASAASSLIGGSRLALDKNLFYEKSMSALVATMNANRKAVLINILTGMGASLDGYPFERALMDLNDFYLAGTLLNAVSEIQVTAGMNERESDKNINKILDIRNRPEDFVSFTKQALVSELLNSIESLTDNAVLDLAKMPPTTDDGIDGLVNARDPNNLRSTDPDVARQILKMRIVMIDRNETSLNLWRAAISVLPQK